MGAALAAWLSAAAAVAQDPAKPSADVEARLSAAALAEAKGEYEVALRELQEASRLADEASRPRIQEAVTALVQRHRQGSSPQRAPGQDPVLDLIATLDRGTGENKQVYEAMRQLQQLGALAVAPVLKKLPDLGPFGLFNAIELLAPIDDPRIAPALLQLLDKSEPSVALAVAGVLDSMTPTTAHTLAIALAADNRPVPAQLAALEKLLEHDAEAKLREQLVQRLLEVPAAHAQLLGLIERPFSLGDGVLERLADEAQGDIKHRARHYLLLHSELTEAQALDGLQQLPPAWRGSSASDLAASHDDWVQVGIVAITATPPQGFDKSWFRSMQWWRAGDDAAIALVSTLPHLDQARRTRGSNTQPRDIDAALRSMVAHGWRMSPQLEPAIAAMAEDNGWSTFVAALPEDGEDRALAVLQRLDARNRYGIFTAALSMERRWNRVFVECLDALESPAQLAPNMIERDWRDIDAATTQRFAQVVSRWQKEWPPLDPRRRQATTTAGVQAIDWRMSLCNAVRLFGLPARVLQPLVDAHDDAAWVALADVDPRAALDDAKSWPDIEPIAKRVLSLITEAGDSRDVPLLAAVLRGRLERRQSWASLPVIEFAMRQGGGQLPLLELASYTAAPRCADNSEVSAIAPVARMAHFADLASLATMLPDLRSLTAKQVLESLQRQLRPDNAAQLVTAAQTILRGEARPTAEDTIPRPAIAVEMLRMLNAINATEALPLARQLLARSDLEPDMVVVAAFGVVRLAKTDREQILGELLADDSPIVVARALQASDIGALPALWPKIEQAIVRHCTELGSLDTLFANLPHDERVRMAFVLTENEQLSRFAISVCTSIVQVLGAEKNGDLAEAIARVGRHPRPEVRTQAADALGNTFSKEAVVFLIDWLRDEDPTVRQRANERLADIATYFEAKEKWSELLK